MSGSQASTGQPYTVLDDGLRYETVELVLSTIPNFELKQKGRILHLFAEVRGGIKIKHEIRKVFSTSGLYTKVELINDNMMSQTVVDSEFIELREEKEDNSTLIQTIRQEC